MFSLIYTFTSSKHIDPSTVLGFLYALVVELVYTTDLKSVALMGLRVQLSLKALALAKSEGSSYNGTHGHNKSHPIATTTMRLNNLTIIEIIALIIAVSTINTVFIVSLLN